MASPFHPDVQMEDVMCIYKLFKTLVLQSLHTFHVLLSARHRRIFACQVARDNLLARLRILLRLNNNTSFLRSLHAVFNECKRASLDDKIHLQDWPLLCFQCPSIDADVDRVRHHDRRQRDARTSLPLHGVDIAK